MKPVIKKGNSFAVIYDASVMEAPEPDYFKTGYWKAGDALVGEAIGRGSAWFIDATFGPVVLRQFLRGGWVAKISRDKYVFTGVENSRPFREFIILSSMLELGLPVPRPVAALCEHHGVVSTGALLTARIAGAQTLADLLPADNADSETRAAMWGRIGQCIREFHDAGVWHADLNARNIMLDEQLQVFLIDFDRARFTPGKVVDGEGNLKRLKRSLVKLWPDDEIAAMQAAWILLEAGYHD
ncbi:MAG: 3-deoxy-D-manno-octulosonic acid kinase [Xanthomonadales bacterium]|nr:3-deoxy-D-manno-octulosonic acid kinase [Xanthomonadales bacterium]